MAATLAAALAHTNVGSARTLAGAYDPSLDYGYRILSNPKTGDAFLFRNAMQQTAQQRSNAIFGSLASLLGGAAPTVDFVQSIPPAPGLPEVHLASDQATDQVILDPYATWGLIADKAPIHDGALNQMPHEMAHLRQVAADVPTREGGAQAFADLVAQTAATRAKIPNTLGQEPAGQFDGAYSGYVQQAQQKGRDWLLAGQFGKTGSPTWP